MGFGGHNGRLGLPAAPPRKSSGGLRCHGSAPRPARPLERGPRYRGNARRPRRMGGGRGHPSLPSPFQPRSTPPPPPPASLRLVTERGLVSIPGLPRGWETASAGGGGAGGRWLPDVPPPVLFGRGGESRGRGGRRRGWGGGPKGDPAPRVGRRERGGGEGKAGQGREEEEEEEEARASFSCPRSASESREPCGDAKPGLGIAARAPPAPVPAMRRLRGR